MTVAVVSLCVVIAGLVASLAWALVEQRNLAGYAARLLTLANTADRRADAAVRERDQFAIQAAQAAVKLNAAIAALTVAERAAQAAREERNHVLTTALNGATNSQLIALSDSLFAGPLDARNRAVAATADGDGRPAAPAALPVGAAADGTNPGSGNS